MACAWANQNWSWSWRSSLVITELGSLRALCSSRATVPLLMRTLTFRRSPMHVLNNGDVSQNHISMKTSQGDFCLQAQSDFQSKHEYHARTSHLSGIALALHEQEIPFVSGYENVQP